SPQRSPRRDDNRRTGALRRRAVLSSRTRSNPVRTCVRRYQRAAWAGRACPDGRSGGPAGRVPEEVAAVPVWTGELPTFDGLGPGLRMRWDEDGDGDGIPAGGGTDCDDAEPRAFGGASESCDLVDNDCDGTVDESCPCAPVGAVEDCPTPCGSTGDRTCEESGWSACVLRR